MTEQIRGRVLPGGDRGEGDARRKEERFADAGEMAEALRHPEQVDLSILARRDPPLSAPISESLLKHPLVVLGLLAVGTAVAVVLAEVLLRR